MEQVNRKNQLTLQAIKNHFSIHFEYQKFSRDSRIKFSIFSISNSFPARAKIEEGKSKASFPSRKQGWNLLVGQKGDRLNLVEDRQRNEGTPTGTGEIFPSPERSCSSHLIHPPPPSPSPLLAVATRGSGFILLIMARPSLRPAPRATGNRCSTLFRFFRQWNAHARCIQWHSAVSESRTRSASLKQGFSSLHGFMPLYNLSPGVFHRRCRRRRDARLPFFRGTVVKFESGG